VLLAALSLLATGCGGSSAPGPPVGAPVLPDLVPAPPRNLQTKVVNGRWHVGFSTIVVNVGEGDFLVRGRRNGDGWQVEQGIPYSVSGVEMVPVDAPLEWGGDGHDHWHIQRVASVELVPLDDEERPVADGESRVDSKIGFCFYDHTHELGRGPVERVYVARGCGREAWDVIGMGLSSGWNDTYRSVLPGQNIDVTGLPDGMYRLWTRVDEKRWFREQTRDNNATWIDFELFTKDEQRFALAVAHGPQPA